MSTTSPAARVLDLPVEGMTCGSCSARVHRTLSAQDGVRDVEVNLATHHAHLMIDPDADLAALADAVQRAGYTMHVPETADQPATGGRDTAGDTEPTTDPQGAGTGGAATPGEPAGDAPRGAPS
ncbi:MAG: heavy-metal-associated domain-containing protein, partial [Nitriliruptoraceae bacterium]|nr:heavy-metal-associated domain-containing protein [Nitriliruptoraceae bacterium]